LSSTMTMTTSRYTHTHTHAQGDAVELDYDDPYLKIDFPAAQTLPPPCISVMNVSFGYEEGRLLYENLNFGIDCDSRVAIVGPNGQILLVCVCVCARARAFVSV
jgi:ATPase subunit of ABC transporter with duplicated ATPase domains